MIALNFSVNATPLKNKLREKKMASSQKDLVRQWIEGIWNQGDFDLLDTMADQNYVFSTPGQDDLNPAGFKDFVNQIHNGFSDYRIEIVSQMSEHDTVITKGISRGTHSATFNGIEPTHKSIEVHWVMYTQVKDSKMVHDWEIYDALGILTQLGILNL